MTQWKCKECGKKSPRKTRDELIELGWAMVQCWVGKVGNKEYFTAQYCPKHSDLMDGFMNRMKTKLKER